MPVRWSVLLTADCCTAAAAGLRFPLLVSCWGFFCVGIECRALGMVNPQLQPVTSHCCCLNVADRRIELCHGEPGKNHDQVSLSSPGYHPNDDYSRQYATKGIRKDTRFSKVLTGRFSDAHAFCAGSKPLSKRTGSTGQDDYANQACESRR